MEYVLDSIYHCDGDKYYRIMEVDEKLLHVRTKLLSFDEMNALQNKEQCDFLIADGVLKCNSLIKTVQIDERYLRKMQDAAVESELAKNSLYSLLIQGVQNGYIILADDSEDGWGSGTGVIPFRSIQFSKTTMSVYVRVIDGAGVYNQMIIVPEDRTLKFRPFKFAIEAETAENVIGIEGCEDLSRKVVINGKEYCIWVAKMFNIYDRSVEFSPSVVNQSVHDSVVYQTSLKMINAFIRGVSNEESLGYTWWGGDKSYSLRPGVYFKSSSAVPTEAELQEMQEIILENAAEGRAEVEINKHVFEYLFKRKKFNRVGTYSTALLTKLVLSDGDAAQKLLNAFSTKRAVQEKIFWLGLYLYRIRSCAMLDQRTLCSVQSCLVGGNTQEFTIVNTI